MSNEYHNELSNKNDKKLGKSDVFSLMKPFVEEVNKYPAAQIECPKQKRADAVQRGSDVLMPSHIKFQTVFNEYANSVVLVGNEIAMSHMIKEVALFNIYLENFYKDTKKVNNVQELQSYYKQFKLKPKDLVDALLKDLEFYSIKYGFELDKKKELTFYKEEKLKIEEEIKEKMKEK